MYECSVFELNNLIKNFIDDNVDKQIKLTGEISNIKKSGKNIWITLKDDKALISCIFWDNFNMNHNEGDKVVIEGKLSFYSKLCKVNFIGRKIEAIGVGKFHKEYQENFKKFKEKGYFNNSKPLPSKINSVGIITAKTGAALQDIMYVLKSGGFNGNIYIYSCSVQGVNCPPSVVDGINYFNNNKTMSKKQI